MSFRRLWVIWVHVQGLLLHVGCREFQLSDIALTDFVNRGIFYVISELWLEGLLFSLRLGEIGGTYVDVWHFFQSGGGLGERMMSLQCKHFIIPTNTD